MTGTKPIDPVNIVELQLLSDALRDRALVCYVSETATLEAIRQTFVRAFAALTELQPSPARCPDDWMPCPSGCCPPYLRLARIEAPPGRSA